MNIITLKDGLPHIHGHQIGNLDTPIDRVWKTARSIDRYPKQTTKVVVEPHRTLMYHSSGVVFQLTDDES